MIEYLNSEGLIGTNLASGPLGDTQPASDASKPGMDWSIFRAQFCVAAQELANDLHLRLQDLGVLHTELMITGIDIFNSHTISTSGSPKLQDVESDEITKTSGKGQTIFISRNVDLREAKKLVALGFRFATLANASGKSTRVLDIMAAKMQVEKLDLSATLKVTKPVSAISIPVEMSPYLKPHSHYISLFALHPRVQSSNCQWDVMVYKEALNMIPHVSYGIGTDLDASVHSMLRNFEGKAPDAICSLLNETKAKYGLKTEHDVALIDWIIDSIQFFREHIPQPIFQNALFCPTPIMVPIVSSIHGDQSYATIWSFTVVMGVHDSRGDDQNDELWSWIPFNLFQCLQVTGRGFPHQTTLARESHMEFSTLLDEASRQSTAQFSRKYAIVDRVYNTLSKVHHKTDPASSPSRMPGTFTQLDGSSDKELVRVETDDCNSHISAVRSPFSFGGILVSYDITQSDTNVDPTIELQDIGLKSTAEVATDEEHTWADDLYVTLSRKWLSRGYRENRGDKQVP
ncbi:hypothetical protein PSPO01_15814 [Paraphaeosphaeria sporulosa]